MDITTRARDPFSDRVSIWVQRAIETYDYAGSELTPEERHRDAARCYVVALTGRLPTALESRKLGPYQRETWLHSVP